MLGGKAGSVGTTKALWLCPESAAAEHCAAPLTADHILGCKALGRSTGERQQHSKTLCSVFRKALFGLSQGRSCHLPCFLYGHSPARAAAVPYCCVCRDPKWGPTTHPHPHRGARDPIRALLRPQITYTSDCESEPGSPGGSLPKP